MRVRFDCPSIWTLAGDEHKIQSKINDIDAGGVEFRAKPCNARRFLAHPLRVHLEILGHMIAPNSILLFARGNHDDDCAAEVWRHLRRYQQLHWSGA